MRQPSFIRSERGAAIVEFAIVLPLLLLFIFGIIDFGRALYMKNNLTLAAREGARIASVQGPYPTFSPVNLTVIAPRVKLNTLPFGGDSVKTSMISATVDVGLPNSNYVTVTISNYPFKWLTPLPTLLGFPNPLNMSASATMRWEFAPGP